MLDIVYKRTNCRGSTTIPSEQGPFPLLDKVKSLGKI